VLFHSGVKWDIIILNPSTKWVKKKDWVLISELEELISGILEEEYMTIVEWVSKLECINCISISFKNVVVNLFWS
jgi:hypothetical protein